MLEVTLYESVNGLAVERKSNRAHLLSRYPNYEATYRPVPNSVLFTPPSPILCGPPYYSDNTQSDSILPAQYSSGGPPYPLMPVASPSYSSVSVSSPLLVYAPYATTSQSLPVNEDSGVYQLEQRSIFIKGLPPDISSGELRRRLERYGPVDRLITRPDYRNSRSGKRVVSVTASATFAASSVAHTAVVELDGVFLKGCRLNVSFDRDRAVAQISQHQGEHASGSRSDYPRLLTSVADSRYEPVIANGSGHLRQSATVWY